MTIFLKNICFFSTIFLLFICNAASAQFTIDAGSDAAVCPGAKVTLGGTPTATGGVAPYTYQWAPATGLSSTTIANPILTPTTYTNYTLTVTDSSGQIRTDNVFIYMTYINSVDAGNDTSICLGDSALIGNKLNVSGQGITYSWSPSMGLNDTTLPRPYAKPMVTTTYTLTDTMAGCPPKTSFVTVTVIPIPHINAGLDTTIQEGMVATLHASGGFFYIWYPQTTLTYPYTANPNAEPTDTTIYYLYGKDATGECGANDTVIVNVIPDVKVTIYNTFTPNDDSNNDEWYIGNIWKYPNNKLEIYNRYGKIVYKKNNYQNEWDGKSYGVVLPAATYFYILDLGDDKGIYHGTVSIVR
jgi:gliding motility-associated-like protein